MCDDPSDKRQVLQALQRLAQRGHFLVRYFMVEGGFDPDGHTGRDVMAFHDTVARSRTQLDLTTKMADCENCAN